VRLVPLSLLGAALLVGLAGPPISALGASSPGTLTVRLIGGATKTTLHLQPGFATVIRADQRIDTVAIGDPRLVTATTVKRGQDVYDLVLQPQTASGTTNMVVWFDAVTSIWELVIGPGQRSADVVYVVTAAWPASRAGATTQSPASPSPSSPVPIPPNSGEERGDGSPRVSAPGAPPAPASGPRSRGDLDAVSTASTAPPFLEARQTVGDAAAVFKVLRTRDAVVIHYQITNNGGQDLAVRLSGVLVRVNGGAVPFALARSSADRVRPALLPRGMTETGVIDAPAAAPRQVDVEFSLFPLNGDDLRLGPIIPLTFQPMFSGVDRLAPTIAP